MKTPLKVGDRIRICFNAWVKPKSSFAAHLSLCAYAVERILKNGSIIVRTRKGGFPLTVKSWVRVSP